MLVLLKNTAGPVHENWSAACAGDAANGTARLPATTVSAVAKRITVRRETVPDNLFWELSDMVLTILPRVCPVQALMPMNGRRTEWKKLRPW
ncbi:hypothetical protein [Micromonospora sp. NPDC049799]|uniref:hypothetical protein n=1 Tax=Micromonospora sp. NPDC049799 TaxID=3154741 RepID=UPI0033E98403